ncbi:hypothetical protein [Aurantimonas sp. A3-2-R12]|uniref:hypothetical protein n=1 Tax=Aurantimonas sp. A3-2-R12 TaxID=3114362 RepID=UPI002E16D37B|nr:hypothetical protein [Aurantimonas sp. A3-2-R12]
MRGFEGRARLYCVRRSVVGQLRAQQLTLDGEDTLGLLDLALGSRTGIRRHPVRTKLRQTEQHKRQHNKKPRQDRAKSSHIVRQRVCHPRAAQT